MRKRVSVNQITRLALLAALALALSALEGIFTPALPPGAKAGLSNIVVMLAASSMGLPSALALAIVKALYALLMRGALAFFMSLAGGVASALVLYLLFRLPERFGTLDIGMAGAAVHNAMQGAVALIVLGKAVLGYLPLLLVLSLPAGLITGALHSALSHIVRRRDLPERKESLSHENKKR